MPFYYFMNPKGAGRAQLPFQLRDVYASMELQNAFRELGYETGESILNTPPPNPPIGATNNVPLLPIDLSHLGPEDLILLVTRPPLHEDLEQPRSRVDRGFTQLEEDIFDVLKNYFHVCSRKKVWLEDPLRSSLEPGYEDRGSAEFRVNGECAAYKLLANKKPKIDPATAGYFLRIDDFIPDGPGLVVAFGMDGVTTLVWAHRLARDFRYLLEEPGFAMVEMTIQPRPPRATDYGWADDWPIALICRETDLVL